MKTALLIEPNICPPVDNVLLASHHTDGHLDFAGNIPGRSLKLMKNNRSPSRAEFSPAASRGKVGSFLALNP